MKTQRLNWALESSVILTNMLSLNIFDQLQSDPVGLGAIYSL